MTSEILLAIGLTLLVPTQEATVTVVVTDSLGQPLSGALVEVLRGSGGGSDRASPTISVKTDELGSVVLTLALFREISIRASFLGFLTARVGPLTPVYGSRRGAIPAEIRLTLNIVPSSLSDDTSRAFPAEVWNSPHVVAEPELNDIRAAVIKQQVRTYDELEPQYDDPIGRRYCLAFDRSLQNPGRPAPVDFVRRFSDHPEVRELDWCEANQGRVISVGPVEYATRRAVVIWSFSWIESRPGGSDCLRLLLHRRDRWEQDGGCLAGTIYN